MNDEDNGDYNDFYNDQGKSDDVHNHMEPSENLQAGTHSPDLFNKFVFNARDCGYPTTTGEK